MNAPAKRPAWWLQVRIRPRNVHPVTWLRRVASLDMGRSGRGPTEVQLRAWERRRSALFHRALEARLGRKLETNVPPPGWSVEEDIREEARALGELANDYRTRRAVNDE